MDDSERLNIFVNTYNGDTGNIIRESLEIYSTLLRHPLHLYNKYTDMPTYNGDTGCILQINTKTISTNIFHTIKSELAQKVYRLVY